MTSASPLILVTGASGQLGALVVEALLGHVPAGRIVATARDTASLVEFAKRDIAVRQADYAIPHSLHTAFAGVGRVLLVSSNAVGQRVPQHRNVIEAAKRAGVELLAYTSILHADTSTLSLAAEHVATEALLRDSGVPHALLRNGWYTENYTGSIAAEVAHGAVIGSSGEGRISAATRADYAAALQRAGRRCPAGRPGLRAGWRYRFHDGRVRRRSGAAVGQAGGLSGSAGSRLRGSAGADRPAGWLRTGVGAVLGGLARRRPVR